MEIAVWVIVFILIQSIVGIGYLMDWYTTFSESQRGDPLKGVARWLAAVAVIYFFCLMMRLFL